MQLRILKFSLSENSGPGYSWKFHTVMLVAGHESGAPLTVEMLILLENMARVNLSLDGDYHA